MIRRQQPCYCRCPWRCRGVNALQN